MATIQPEAFWCDRCATFVPLGEVVSGDLGRQIHDGQSLEGGYCGAPLIPRPFTDPLRYIGQTDPPPRK